LSIITINGCIYSKCLTPRYVKALFRVTSFEFNVQRTTLNGSFQTWPLSCWYNVTMNVEQTNVKFFHSKSDRQYLPGLALDSVKWSAFVATLMSFFPLHFIFYIVDDDLYTFNTSLVKFQEKWSKISTYFFPLTLSGRWLPCRRKSGPLIPVSKQAHWNIT
jgi:hypothetical protein